MAGEEPENGKTTDNGKAAKNGKGEHGEGNYAASRDYNERTRKFMEEKDETIDEKAEEAEEALYGEEGESLREAEEEGKSHARR